VASWYKNSRDGFLHDELDAILGHLHGEAAADGWQIDPDQDEEWRHSLRELKDAIRGEPLKFIDGVLAEYDFRRRGIRIDFILVAPGALFVLEFKRGTIGAADRDQVMNYCINLVEFHERTQRDRPNIFPVLVSRHGARQTLVPSALWHPDWPQILSEVAYTRACDLGETLRQLHQYIPLEQSKIQFEEWDASPFHPSSSIVDAAISLYGQHDVSAMKAHAVPKEDLDRCRESVIAEIKAATLAKRHELIIVSGAPGAGKTLVGLAIAFHNEFRNEAVFVTGNAPLVEVLNGSLQRSYLNVRRQSRIKPLGGYTRKGVGFVAQNTDFKIVKAHNFLECARGETTGRAKSTDGRILVFDEAQRTYAAGTYVNRRRLEQDEAILIVDEMAQRPGSVIVLLMGHNQDINAAEMGAKAWLQAARAHRWNYAVSDETLALEEFSRADGWASDDLRLGIAHTHLSHSMRDQKTRNGEIERWAHYVMTNQPYLAAGVAKLLPRESGIHLTRSLASAKTWAQSKRTGEERVGLIGSGQGRRLRSEGIFVDEKPDIVHWMLAPSDDVRSSNMLEQTQNQYQIQGLEIDYAVVCWDADLRRVNDEWACFNVNGGGWAKSTGEIEARRNSYRVLLTRSRKGMALFIPPGDKEGRDESRATKLYDDIADYLVRCGARPLDEVSNI
jgi:hypothetical protein